MLEGQASRLLDQTAQSAQIVQEVGDGIFFAATGQAEAVHALEAQVLNRAIAALRQITPPIALFPGLGACP